MSENPWEKKPEGSGSDQPNNPWRTPSDNPWGQQPNGSGKPAGDQQEGKQSSGNQGGDGGSAATPASPNAPRDSGKETTDPDLRSSNPEDDWAALANSPEPPNYQRNVGPAGAVGYGQGYQQGQYQQGWGNGQGYNQGFQQGPHQQGPPPQEQKKSGKVWWIVLAIVLLLALIGGGLWWFLAGNKGSDDSQEPVTVFETEYEDDETTTSETEDDEDDDEGKDTEEDEPEDPNGPSAAASPADYPSGLGSHGWSVSENARCNANDEWVYAAANDSTYVAICENPDNGQYYYRGHSDGLGYEDDVVMGTADVAKGKFQVPAAPNTIWIDGKTLRVTAPDGGELDSQRLPKAVYNPNY